METFLTVFLTSTIGGVYLSAFSLSSFSKRKVPLITLEQKAGWAARSIWTDEKTNIFYLWSESNHNSSMVQAVACHYTD